MTNAIAALSHCLPSRSRLFRPIVRAAAGAAVAGLLAASPAAARGPDGIADVAEKVIDAVVNISTSQTVEARGGEDMPNMQLPPGSPFQEFFDDFLKNRRGGKGGDKGFQPRKVNSLGSGFIIDTAGIVVTNNHVIADADEINVILNDGTKYRAQVMGRDKKTDLAVLKFTPDKQMTAVKFGDSDKLRLGEWVVAIGNPFSLGGTVTAGIVSARNRDINSGPYDNYIQTDAAINRGNSGGPLFNLDGEVIGVNTAIISPSGGSIGIGFAVPSKTVAGVVEQLRQFGETRRGWLGVRIQQVTDEIADSLNIKPARGALIAGVEDKGPAKPAGIEPGDVIVKFDGKDIKEMKDLPRAVADTAVGKSVDVIVIRKGKEETRQVTLGRLPDDEKPTPASAKSSTPDTDKTVTQKALGLDLAALTKDLRTRFKIKESVKGVIITGVDGASDAADKRLSAGDVIVEVAQEAVTNGADVKKRVDQLKKDGKKSVLLLIANADGELRFVALSLQ
ncbi:DegQ family serine endoprotease [Bradyrhizobium sp. U87765 SZCCT0131]|uniref:DegQ family serine endoprotease n=1 Tax=unclassified Bradyrhizobium TaxID=2631580 RepID=UPI001BA63604|nr:MULTISPECIES: DegQ family serine endoprotease [unclassified Bradyrhizobium]MBR1222257.1 DegQ family serine endoprotease [Bradyrhizobium sp. U87765 SZCCT0131]MBR1264259.1 DegQ family serine endoprotease [Bradyrhizobium sp. U87765 SZCCT0134]MBR1307958.1 DegQ family serine endoprotease [Bradyrhizobium sp. U87765 SZCCT0110]MBR1320509.1 DegQ family serine endoprotease [Bradyrhizobium sp. U87765 SZCCT0109]MBR1348378.1 DegQ family serine endoprotease [Bradyrhizobium sp. U87765 SZCCT0048]